MSKSKSSLPTLHRVEDDTEPIVDFPIPPVQIVSCRHCQTGVLIPLGAIRSAPVGEIPQVAFLKMKQCHRPCDFSDPNADASSKAVKTQALNELIDCYSTPKLFRRLVRETHQQLIEMFSVNIFRPLPNLPREILAADDGELEDTAWSHLQLLYTLFLIFINSQIDPRILQFQLTPRFLTNLFAMLDFPDERERVQVRTVITALFDKVPQHRPLLRVITCNLLMSVPGGYCINAASHLLELFYEFTSRSATTQAASEASVFERVLLPLHLGFRCQRYFGSLVRCVLLMVEKENRLGNLLLQFLITHWPMTFDHKAELFIDEVVHLVQDHPDCFDRHTPRLMECIAVAAESPCTTLAERAFGFVMHERVREIIAGDPYTMMRILFPPLYRVTRSHWAERIQLRAVTAMNLLVEVNPLVCAEIAAEFRKESLNEAENKAAQRDLWTAVAETAAKKIERVDTERVARQFATFFDAVQVPGGSSTARQTRRLLADR
jgi:serine/threonine-protein phosphatase 2A regulatory subunit B'